MDKTSKRILKYFVSQNCGTDFVCLDHPRWSSFYKNHVLVDDLAEELGLREKDMLAVFKYLNENGYLEREQNGTAGSRSDIGFKLSHKGLHWKYFRRREVLDYIAEKWPDFIAVVISIISLITAILSGLN